MSFSAFKVLWMLKGGIQKSKTFKSQKKANAFIERGRSKGFKVLFFGL